MKRTSDHCDIDITTTIGKKSAVCFDIKIILVSNTTSGAKLPAKTAQIGPHLIVPPYFSIKVVFLES